MTENEMNNQAAQTMPERTYMTRDEALKIARACAYAKCHTHGYLPRTAQEAADWEPHEWVLDAIRWNALAQTAGVPDVLFDGYAVYQGMTDEARARINAGGVSDVLDSVVRLIRAQAAPAASGGECNCASGRGAEHCVVHAHAAWDAPQSPSTASVSERARALLAAEFARAGMPFNAADCARGEVSPTYEPALRAIEQALNQQRVCATCGGRGEIGGHVGQTAETFDYVTEPCPECTTPQPSADAVRELVKRWRDEANAGYLTGDALIDCATTNRQSVFFQCANELESLLSAASGEGV